MNDPLVPGQVTSGFRLDAGAVVLTLPSNVAAGDAVVLYVFVAGPFENDLATQPQVAVAGGGVTWTSHGVLAVTGESRAPDLAGWAHPLPDGMLWPWVGRDADGTSGTITVTLTDGVGPPDNPVCYGAAIAYEFTGISDVLTDHDTFWTSGDPPGPGVPGLMTAWTQSVVTRGDTESASRVAIAYGLGSRSERISQTIGGPFGSAGQPGVTELARVAGGDFAGYVTGLAPARWFRCDDAGSTMTDAMGHGNGTWPGTHAPITGLLTGDTNGAMALDSGGTGLLLAAHAPDLGDDFRITLRFRRPAALIHGVASTEVLVAHASGLTIWVNEGHVRVDWPGGGANTAAQEYLDIGPHTVTLRKAPGGAGSYLLVDGQLQQWTAGVAVVPAGAADMTFGGSSAMTIDEIILEVAPATDVDAARRLHYAAASMLVAAYSAHDTPGTYVAQWQGDTGSSAWGSLWAGIGTLLPIVGPAASLAGTVSSTTEVVGVLFARNDVVVPAAVIGLPERYVFADTDLARFDYLMQKMAGADDHPPLRGQDNPYPGIPGAQYLAKLPGSRTVTFALLVGPLNADGSGGGGNESVATRTNLDAMQAILARRRQQRLIRVMPDGTGRLAEAEIVSVTEIADTSNVRPTLMGLTVQAVLADPWWYGSLVYDNSSAPRAISASPTDWTITNTGTVPTRRVLLELLGPISGSVAIRNLTTGVALLCPDLGASQRLVIDAQATIAWLNGGNAIGLVTHIGDASLMRFDPGVNALRVEAGTPGGTLLTSWQPAYV